MCFVGCDTGKNTMRLFVNKVVYTIVVVAMISSLILAATKVLEPEFAEAIPNVTVVAGGDVSLPCVIDNQGPFKVAWIHADRHALLTLMYRVIVRNSRYKVTHDDYRTWWLHISEVHEQDKGEYECRIVTSPMKIQRAYINVVGSTEVPYGLSPNLNASSISSENDFHPTNFNTEPEKPSLGTTEEIHAEDIDILKNSPDTLNSSSPGMKQTLMTVGAYSAYLLLQRFVTNG